MLSWPLAGSLFLPNAGGWASAVAMVGQVRSPNGKSWYDKLKKPSWGPPNWVFGPAWTILYTGMGYASYVVYKDSGGFTAESIPALTLYGGHLLVNWTCPLTFFVLHRIDLAQYHLLALGTVATACTISFAKINRSTVYFMAPYLCWLAFASCINYSIWKLNGSHGDLGDKKA